MSRKNWNFIHFFLMCWISSRFYLMRWIWFEQCTCTKKIAFHTQFVFIEMASKRKSYNKEKENNCEKDWRKYYTRLCWRARYIYIRRLWVETWKWAQQKVWIEHKCNKCERVHFIALIAFKWRYCFCYCCSISFRAISFSYAHLFNSSSAFFGCHLIWNQLGP